MTAAPRITKIVCPSCEGGESRFAAFGLPCMWCHGKRRVSVETARNYANTIWIFAGGGYIVGDYSYEEKIEQETKAERIYKLTGMKAPWLAEGRSK